MALGAIIMLASLLLVLPFLLVCSMIMTAFSDDGDSKPRHGLQGFYKNRTGTQPAVVTVRLAEQMAEKDGIIDENKQIMNGGDNDADDDHNNEDTAAAIVTPMQSQDYDDHNSGLPWALETLWNGALTEEQWSAFATTEVSSRPDMLLSPLKCFF
jgi:hypothetical protein